MSGLNFFKRIPLLRFLFEKTLLPRASFKFKLIAPFLKGKILDVGTGTGALVRLMQLEGLDTVKSLDVKDLSYFETVTPILYDGLNFPVKNDAFDCCTIITVLHHTPDPDYLVREASRIAPRIIIMEDVYTNRIQKSLTLFMDSLINLEFKGHPHTNKNELEWEQLFKELGLKIESKKVLRTLLIFRQVVYVLSRN